MWTGRPPRIQVICKSGSLRASRRGRLRFILTVTSDRREKPGSKRQWTVARFWRGGCFNRARRYDFRRRIFGSGYRKRETFILSLSISRWFTRHMETRRNRRLMSKAFRLFLAPTRGRLRPLGGRQFDNCGRGMRLWLEGKLEPPELTAAKWQLDTEPIRAVTVRERRPGTESCVSPPLPDGHGSDWHQCRAAISALCHGVALLGIALTATSAWAQVSAAISGRVEDASGAPVGGAKITVKSLETGAMRVVTGNDAGAFRALSLPVGPQEVRAAKPGFKAAVRLGINLALGQEAVVNLRLEVGEFAQQVMVLAEAPVVNATTAAVSGLVGERQVKDLPLNGRSFDNLLTLNPGAINYSAMKSPQTSTSNGNIFSVAGRRPMDNIVLLNGIEYTGSSQLAVTPGGVSGSLLGIDAVREFNVLTETYGAEYGKRAGGQVTGVTQSGANTLHGTLIEFLRNSALDARNFFDQASVAPLRRNQFGGALGGPIKKDKLFLFGNYEASRRRLGISNVAVVPNAQARLGMLP